MRKPLFLTFSVLIACYDVPEEVPAPMPTLARSRYLDPLWELANPGDELIVDRDDIGPGNTFETWDELLAEPVDTITLMPGDYSDIVPGSGVFPDVPHVEFAPATSGNAQRRRVLRAFGDTPPERRSREDEVRIGGLQFGVGTGSHPGSYWIVHGVSMRDFSWTNAARDASHHIVIDSVLVERGSSAYGFRVLLKSHDITIQRSVMRDPATLTDGVAVQLRAPSDGQPSDEMHNVRVLSNVFQNYNDAFAITVPNETADPLLFDGTIVDDNDCYLTSAYRTSGNGIKGSGDAYAVAENAFDIKGGSRDPNNPVRLTNNRLRGYRYFDQSGGPSGSDGAAIVIHVRAENIYIGQTQIWDCPVGIRQDAWQFGDPNRSRNLVIEDVTFQGLRRYAPEDRGGVAFVSRLPATIRRSVVSRCAGGFADLPMIIPGTSLAISDAVVCESALGTAAASFASGTGNRTLSADQMYDLEVRTMNEGKVRLPDARWEPQARMGPRPTRAAARITRGRQRGIDPRTWRLLNRPNRRR